MSVPSPRRASVRRVRPVTLALAALLVGWYGFELYVRARVPEPTFIWLFAATAPAPLSPGLVLAPISHGSVVHLANNVIVLLLFGGLVEGHLGPGRYLGLFVGAGLAAVLAQVAAYSLAGVAGATLGASGAAFALATFLGWHYFHHHADDPRESTVARLTYLVALGGTAFPVAALVGAAVGVGSSGGAVYGHLVGALCGVGYEYLGAVLPGDPPCLR